MGDGLWLIEARNGDQHLSVMGVAVLSTCNA
jgi:hypothetical protein